MAKSINASALKLFNGFFGESERDEFPELRKYFESGKSIFPLVEKGLDHLVAQYALPADKAGKFLERANALAAYVAREFIEHSLTRKEPVERALVTGAPTFEEISEIEFSARCPEDALESVDSVVAYLVALFQWLAKLEEYRVGEDKFSLKNRRRDLEKLWIDFASTHGRLSSVEMGTRVLETFIEEHAQDEDDGAVDIDERLKLSRYPFLLPFFRSWEALNTIARYHDLSVGDLVRCSDPSGPAFLAERALTVYSDRALRLDSTLGPYRQALLTVEPVFPEFTDPMDATPDVDTAEAEKFYEDDFGADTIQAQDLNEKKEFGRRTELRTEDIEAVLSYMHFAPVRSLNAPSESVDDSRVGSIYINGSRKPDLEIHEQDNLHRIRHIPNWRVERLSRLIRLNGWLRTTPPDTDALIMAVNRITEPEEGEHECWMTPDTMRALGLFHTFRGRFGCRAEEFVAFLHELLIHGRGDQPSHFDRVFNARTFFPTPLKIDDAVFPLIPDPANPEHMLTVNQLCSALGINLETYLYLAVVIAGAQGLGNQLSRSLKVFSAFFRLVTLPRQLGISPQEACWLLIVLGGGENTWLNALAGNPCINPSDDGQIDVLHAIEALKECVDWCLNRQLNPSWVIRQLVAQPVPTVVSEAGAVLFDQLRNQVMSVLLTERALQDVAPLPGGREWLVLLKVLVIESGIVTTQSDPREADYESFARPLIEDAVKQAIGELNTTLVETILNLLLVCREGQMKVVREGLVTYAGITSQLALSVLAWAGGQVSQLLIQALKRSTPSEGELAGQRQAEDEEPGDPFLALLEDVLRRAAIVNELEIQERVLSEYLSYGYQKWLALERKNNFSLRVLYYLTIFNSVLEVAQQPIEVLLDYLRRVNALPESTSGDGKRLASEMAANQLAAFLGWSARDVHVCATHLNERALIRTLPELDVLLAVHKKATQMGLDAQTIIDIGKLPPELRPGDNDTKYRLVAERALESVSQQSIATDTTALEAFATDIKVSCEVDKRLLVANKAGEVATFKVTLTDAADNSLKGIGIRWLARLGRFEHERVLTDENGIAVAKLHSHVSGSRIAQGVETPQFTVDMDEPRLADSVVIGSDELTLKFDPEMKSPIPELLGLDEEIELYAALYNGHPLNNPGIGKQVSWSSEQGTIRPETTFTDTNGITRVVFTRTHPGVCTISVTYSPSKATTEFEFPAIKNPK